MVLSSYKPGHDTTGQEANIQVKTEDLMGSEINRGTLRVKRLIRPGSLKKMLFLTRSPLTWECSMVTRQARGAVPLQTNTEGNRITKAEGGFTGCIMKNCQHLDFHLDYPQV